jgi:thioredoxin-like negative regulator of GroEL
MITHTTDVSPAEFTARLAAQNSTLLVVYLWGPNCPNCVIFKRSLPKLLERLSDIDADLIELDVYAHPEIATRFGVMGIPHFLLFKGGIKLGKMSEFKGETYWANVIRENA